MYVYNVYVHMYIDKDNWKALKQENLIYPCMKPPLVYQQVDVIAYRIHIQ